MKTMIPMYILGGIIIVGFFALLIMLVLNAVPTENSDLLNLVVGALIGSFASVVQFYYGSSQGSKDKTKIMAKEQENDTRRTN